MGTGSTTGGCAGRFKAVQGTLVGHGQMLAAYGRTVPASGVF